MTANSTKTLVVIDSGLDDYHHLAEGVLANAEVAILEPHQDGIAQITQLLESRRNIDALHLLSHAAPGLLSLGSTRITLKTLSDHAQALQTWASAFSRKAEILLYGCRLADSPSGRSLIQHMAQLTQTAIAASSTLTGSSELGGDWNLAARTAAMSAIPALQADTMRSYNAVMALFDWSDPGIDWPDGDVDTTNTYNNIDGTPVDVSVTVEATNGVTFGQVGGIDTPNDIASLQGGAATIVEALHVTMDAATLQDSTTTIVEFSQAVDGVAFGIYDIDENFAVEGWQDEVEVIGFLGNTVVQPTLTANNNATYTLNGNVATGDGNATNTGGNSGEGTVEVSFDSPITSYQVIYRNGPDASADPGEQGIAVLSNIFFEDPGNNQEPDTDNARLRISPGGTRQVSGLGGSDPDGTIERFRITSIPASSQGTLFLGDPTNGGTEISAGDRVRANRIDDIFFQASNNFSGATFEYAAIDDEGAEDSTPATVRLRSRGGTTNDRPETNDVRNRIEPDAIKRLKGLGGSDPDGTVEQFRIETLPPTRQGTLFVGNPARNGTPATEGQTLDADDAGRLFFQTTPRFSGASFAYTAIDDQGAADRTPATVQLRSSDGGDDDTTSKRCRRGDTLRGTNGRDRLSGADGRDQVFGRAGDDQLRGRLCDDLVSGRAGDDNILGDAGNDVLNGGDGEDSLEGGGGSDVAQGGKGRDLIGGGAGDDSLLGKSDDDQLFGDAGNDILVGGRGDDQLQGGNDDDVIEGRGGSDRIRGDKGDDQLSGNFGDDSISGRIGEDRINGGTGDDQLSGDAGSDRIRGESGDDDINGGAGSDRLKGNTGDDFVRGGTGEDVVNGGKDDDFLSGRNGNDRLRGASGDDAIRGNDGEDLLLGNRGQDRLNGREGDDTLIGGFDEDLLTGGRGLDIIAYRTIRDGGELGDRIRNFKIGQDRIDISDVLNANQFSNQSPFARYVSLTQVGSATQFDINVAGDEGEDIRTFALIRGVRADDLGRSSFIL